MTTLSVASPSLLDVVALNGPDNDILPIAEILTLQNEILADAVVKEANGPLSHVSSMRTGIAAASMKQFNLGVAATKSTTARVVNPLAHIFSVLEVDVDLLKVSANPKEYLLNESRSHLEGMNQKFATEFFYGENDPASFIGLSPRYNDQSAENARNIITSAATPDSSDNASLWLVGWGPIYLAYPRGSVAGLERKVWGETISDSQGSAGLKGEVYRETYSWNVGLVVEDWRYAVRINFDLEDCVASSGSGPALIDLMTQAIHRIPSIGGCKPVFYGNADVLEMLDRQMMNKSNMLFNTIEDAQGKLVNTFRRIPVRRSDALLSTESGI